MAAWTGKATLRYITSTRRRADHGNGSQTDKVGILRRCGAKVGAGTLVHLLEGFRTHSDPRLLVGYDRSDDASVYYLDENTALVQTTDFFPPIVDDPFLYGQIAAANAISDVYAMGGEPRLALNILCLPESMTGEMVQELLRAATTRPTRPAPSSPAATPSTARSPFTAWPCPALSTPKGS